MNKCLLLTLQCLLLFSIASYGQKNGKNPNSNGNEDGGRVNLLLPHGNIGINTLSPSERLEVIGNVRISNTLFVQDIDVVGLSATNISVREDINVGRNVLVNGNVGIGVLNPSERLEISGNLRVSSHIFTNRLETDSFLGENGVFNQQLRIGELFTVDGLTGLGVAAPVERLEVAGNIKATENLLSSGIQTGTGAFSSSVDISENLKVGGLTGLGVLNPTERLEVEGNVRVSSGIFTETLEGNTFTMNDGAVNNQLTIGGNAVVQGNIGIGNASPVEKLEVSGNVKATGDFLGQNLLVEQGTFNTHVNVGQNLLVTGTSDFTGDITGQNLTVSNQLQANSLTAGNATVEEVLSVGGNTLFSGNTGLGVAVPAERLEVEGNVRVSSTLFTNRLESVEVSLENGDITNQLTVGGNALVSGNIGIGVAAPTEKLDVAGNIRATGNLTANDIAATSGAFAGDLSVENALAVTGTSDFTGQVTAVDLTVSNNLQSNSFSIENGNITSQLTVGGNTSIGGNLGVGVAAPSEKFEVAGNIKANGNLLGNTLNAEQGNFGGNVQVGNGLTVGGASAFTGSVTAQDLTVQNTLELQNGLTLGGSLGIGIATPEATLHVVGDGNFEGTITAVRLVVQDLEVANLDLGAQEGGEVSFDDNLFVNGSLGIGTENIDGYALSVNGKIRASDDIKVYPAAEWADYVFEKGYSLPTIQEVAHYIQENKHLPEMPSAEEVKEEGIHLGEMDAKLLQKIEELTLYIIQLENKNSQMETENQGLAEEMKQLKADVLLIKQTMTEKD